jgi:hypothetical protein
MTMSISARQLGAHYSSKRAPKKNFDKIIHTNWGYWDGVADRKAQRMAKWYRGTHKNYGHFNPHYAEGYNTGLFGGEAPSYALTGK